jgi:hypothetical protein
MNYDSYLAFVRHLGVVFFYFECVQFFNAIQLQ